MSRLLCLIGWPVTHSASPAIHNAAFEALSLDWNYIALGVRPGAVEQGMRRLDELGAAGANVTMPHKRAVVPFLDELADGAAVLRAVNTIVRTPNGLIGHNTDGEGFLRAIAAEAGFDPAGRDCLVLGGGGAARAVTLALAGAGARVKVAARREAQAREVAALATGIDVVTWASPVHAEIVVNATPAREGLPLEALTFEPGMLAVDLIYAPPVTPFLSAARAAGATGLHGLGMLVHQAAISFELWTGRRPPLDVMRRAAVAAVAGGPGSSGLSAPAT